jgi:hypothetical protein
MVVSDLSTLVAVPQWDPIQVLGINQKLDGNFTCSGVKNNTEIRCGYNLRGETALGISNKIDDISLLPPRTATHHLRALADISLCQYHKIQARSKALEWAAAVERLSYPPAPTSIITSQRTPPPPQRPAITPQSTPSQSSGSSSSQHFSEPSNRQPSRDASNSKLRNVDIENKKRQILDDIANLTAQLAMLEAGSGDEDVAASRRATRQSSSRTGLRTALGFGKRYN